jgi:hypothetical protein
MGGAGGNLWGTQVAMGMGAPMVSPRAGPPARRSRSRPRPRGPLGVRVRSGTAEADPRRGSSQAGETTGTE